MNVREDLLTDLVATLYKDNARIKQLETALSLAILTARGDICTHWSDVLPQLIDALKTKE